MKSVYLKNFTATAALLSASLILLITALLAVGRNQLLSHNREIMHSSMDEAARITEVIVEDGEGETDSWRVSMYLSTISNSTGLRLFVTDGEGIILACSDAAPNCSHIGQRLPEQVLTSLQEEGGFDAFLSETALFPGKSLVLAEPVETSDYGIVGYSVVSRDIGSVFELWQAYFTFSLIAVAVILIMTLALSLQYSMRMARPLDEMAEASRHFARGDFSVRVRQEEDFTDEMGALVESFNKMADSLEKSEARRSEFIANVSHELRTPMTTIAGFADGILDGTIPKENQEKYLISIRDETRRLSRLVREMLDTARAKSRAADPRERTVFNLPELLIQTLLSFESRATEKQLDVDPQLPDSPILVRAEKDGITRVIYNLIDNAVKFSRPGTCLTLRVWKENGKAYVSVKDQGETIPPEDLPFIFDRFHKSDRSRSLDKDGVGLGLSLVKSIINSHDEDIVVKSEAGVTEFVFSLSLAE